MRMFLSVSGHSTELSQEPITIMVMGSWLSIANHSSRPTVSQLKSVFDTISNWFGITNHRRLSTVIYAPFIQNSNQLASRLTETTSFPRVFFQLLQFSRERPSFSAHGTALMTKTDLKKWDSFLRAAVSFHSTRSDAGSHQVWQWRDFSRPITILCYAQ